MSKYQSEEKMVLEGRKVKLLSVERSTSADAGVVVDYFRCSVVRDALFKSSIPSKGDLIVDGLQTDAEIVYDLAVHWACLLGFEPGEVRPGRDFYDHTFTVVNEDGIEVGSVSGGGVMQRGTFCFTLKGYGCTSAKPGWESRAHEFFTPLQATITRIDLARDFFKGEYGFQAAYDAYQNDEFSYRGRKPSFDDAGSKKGFATTFYVGKRESGKLFRGYDKGHQFKLMDDPWWRAEVELRNHNRVIPLEALIRPASFFAGAYGFCARILENVEPQAIPTGLKVAEASVERTLQWFEKTVAPSLVHISMTAGFDWLTRMAVEHAHRDKPRSLKGLSSESIKSGVQRACKRFIHTSPEPAGLMPS
ncbi:replication initiation factor domain-containing protein [Limnohabitans sp. T6-20]|uniref:replication initiation factor domain-containing protein n=1 Tax=Limnohabitans sp. T6-20 TaxID=1100725 RepID=UPI000D3CAA7F|nr:replication initiation factor domain-containing protein [Limnohabitans sp. T6-20]PUE08036.1 hypothetical protein B9Z33_13975 [Limnohabitans sp. T6-20]